MSVFLITRAEIPDWITGNSYNDRISVDLFDYLNIHNSYYKKEVLLLLCIYHSHDYFYPRFQVYHQCA